MRDLVAVTLNSNERKRQRGLGIMSLAYVLHTGKCPTSAVAINRDKL